MASNITVTIGADASQLRAQAAVATSEMRSLQREVSKLATAFRQNGDEIVGAKLGQAASQLAETKNRAAELTKQAESLSGGLHGLSLASAGATRELLVLAHEGLIMGNWSRFGGSLMVLAERMGGLHEIVGMVSGGLGAMAAAGLAAAGGVGYLVYQAYEAKKALDGMQATLLLTNRSASAIGEVGKAADDLANKFDISKRSASELLAEIAKARTLSAEQIKQVAEWAAAEGKVRRQAGEEVTDAEIAKKMAEALNDGAAGAIKLANSYNISTAAAEQMLKSGDELGAFRKVISDIAESIRSHGGAWAEAKAKFDEYIRGLSWFAMGSPDAAGIYALDNPPPAPPTKQPTAGNGTQMSVDEALDLIEKYESDGRNIPNYRYDKGHTAQGFYQITNSTWKEFAAKAGVDLSQFPNAMSAPRDMQRNVAAEIYKARGFQPWADFNPALRDAIGGGGGETQFADKAARERQFKDVEQDYAARAIADRNSREREVRDAQQKYDEIRALVRDANKDISEEELLKDDRVHKALIDLNQKQAQLYDQDTARQIAALKAKQAAATDIGEKVRLQQQVIGVIQGRGAMPNGGGVSLPQLDQAQTELAALERQMRQESVQTLEERLSRQRQMGQIELQEFTAQEELKVARRQESQATALANEAAAADAMLAKQREGAVAVLEKAQAEGLATRQTERYADAIKQIDVERATRAAQFLTKQAEAANAITEKWVQPVKQAFDSIGSSIEGALSGLLTRQKTWAQALGDIGKSILQSTVSGAGSILSKLAAQGLGAKAGEGLGEFLGNQLFGLGGSATQISLLSVIASNTTIMAGASTATAASSATSAGTSALSAAGSAGGIMSLFSNIGSFFGFSQGGIVPSAAGGWALPSFAGAKPAMLHSKEMVLPQHLSEGIQNAIGNGSFGNGGGDVHVHFNGPADGPAIDRWFKGMMSRNPDSVRGLLRSGALTPRTA